jgi:hypothetical protein
MVGPAPIEWLREVLVKAGHFAVTKAVYPLVYTHRDGEVQKTEFSPLKSIP